MNTKRLKFFVLPTLAVSISLILPLLALEGLLRFLPVNEGLHTLPVNDRTSIAHFQPNRTSTLSEDWNFALVNQLKTNDFGFVNDIDYDRHAATPLIAFIGDSYVQASAVPYKQTVAGRLGEYLGDIDRVYTFGVSGAPLSQYLAFAAGIFLKVRV